MELKARDTIRNMHERIPHTSPRVLGGVVLIAATAPALKNEFQAEPAHAQPIAERTVDADFADIDSLAYLTYSPDTGFAHIAQREPIPTPTETPTAAVTPEPTPVAGEQSGISARELDKKCGKESVGRIPTKVVVRLNKIRSRIQRLEATMPGMSAECVDNGTTDISLILNAQGLGGKLTYSTDLSGNRMPITSNMSESLAKPAVFKNVPNTTEPQTLKIDKPIPLRHSTKKFRFATYKKHGKYVLIPKPGKKVRGTNSTEQAVYESADQVYENSLGGTPITAYHEGLPGLPRKGQGNSY